jgi:hypothetical protein
MKKLLFILLALSLIGCATQKHIKEDSNTVKIDSVIVTQIEYVEKEIIKSVPDSASIQALLECDSTGQVYLKQIKELKSGKYIQPQIKLVDNIIEVKAKVDSMAIYHELHKKFNKEDSLKAVINNQKYSFEKKADEQVQKTSRYRWTAVILGIVLLLTIVGFGIFIYLRNSSRSR